MDNDPKKDLEDELDEMKKKTEYQPFDPMSNEENEARKKAFKSIRDKFNK